MKTTMKISPAQRLVLIAAVNNGGVVTRDANYAARLIPRPEK